MKKETVGTVYLEIAEAALRRWCGDMPQCDLDALLEDASFSELEGYVGGESSIRAAVAGLRGSVQDLWGYEAPTSLEDYFLHGAALEGPPCTDEEQEIDAALRAMRRLVVRAQPNQLKYITMYMLINIHDQWIGDNTPVFFSKPDRQFVFARTGLIGWSEVEKDLIFVTPIAECIGIKTNATQLRKAYHQHSRGTVLGLQLTRENLAERLATGREFYPALSDKIARHLRANPSICQRMAEQIIARTPALL